MGRSKGKGKKQNVIASQEDPASEKEENGAAYKRRGRPTKPLKDDNGGEEEEAAAKIYEDGNDATDSTVGRDGNSPPATENGRKRKTPGHLKDNIDLVKEENGVGTKLSIDNSTMSIGFRQIGSRRKNKPRRAAEAVVECM